MIPFKRSLGEDSTSLLRPQPILKADSMIDMRAKILMRRVLIILGVVFILLQILIQMGNRSHHLQESVDVVIQTDKILRTTSDKFLSLGLDTSLIKERWYHYDSDKLLLAAKYLAPAHLRMGGTDSDRLIFIANSTGTISHTLKDSNGKIHEEVSNNNADEARLMEEIAVDSIEKATQDLGSGLELIGYYFNFAKIKRNYDNFTMTGEDWTKIYNFAKNAGLSILFDLNVLLRNGDNWESSNAEELIKFSSDHGFDVNWQLGNEPNSFHHVFNVTINGTQLGQDFNKLRNILEKYPRYASSLVVGPDVTRPKRFPIDSATIYMTDFLKSVKSVDAVTWHHYYLNGRSSSLDDFLNPEVFNILRKQIAAMKSVVNSLNVTSPMWLAETASAYGGGAPGLSDTFVDGFLWLDKLGIGAQMGLDVIIRQSLYQGYYALLDKKMNPLPDWWLSVIYKELVGPEVIMTSRFDGPVRIYCHCTASNALLGSKATVTIFGINMTKKKIYLNIHIHSKLTSLPSSSTRAYILTGKENVLSKTTLLNDEELQLNPDGSLPPFKPKIMRTGEMVMPPESIAFFVLHELPVPACREKRIWIK